MIFWIGLVTGLLSGLAVSRFLFSHHYRRFHRQIISQQQDLETSKEVIRQIMYQTHHHGINPIAKRIRGLCQLARLEPDGDEVNRILTIIEDEALTLEKDTLNAVKEFEHLQ